MDGILALGHFCETHGPCVVLSTQKYEEEPKQGLHSLTVPWCESCQSLDLDQALVSREDKCTYVTTRTPLQQDLAFLLKHATVRGLSCEQEGTLYFGDNERGHILSHSFAVHDSLARGFQRKYSIIMLMRDKIHLLNKWPFLLKHIKEISKQLRDYSVEINEKEQAQLSQRAVRQAQGSPNGSGRSLSQLTGKPAIYAHLHLWFTWLLGCQVAIEKPYASGTLPVPKPCSMLRALYQEMGKDIFGKVCYNVLTGIEIKTDDSLMSSALISLYPDCKWAGKISSTCFFEINKNHKSKWEIKCDAAVENKCPFPTLQLDIERALDDSNLKENALHHKLCSVIMQWLHITRVICWCPQIDLQLLQSLNVQKCDIPLLNFWTLMCAESSEKHKSIVKSLHCIYP